MNWQRNLLTAVFALSLSTTLQAGIIADALLSFPAQTEYVEYDNLTLLRVLPNYNELRQQFSGRPLEEAKIVLGQLGIQEEQVNEVVTGSSSNVFYGILSGTFSGGSAGKKARSKSFAVKLLDNEAYCTGRETCVVFLEDSLAAFGSLSRLKDMLDARQGAIMRLNSNRNLVALLNGSDRYAPVRGVLYGGEFKASVSQILQDWTGWKRDWSTVSANVSGIGYSVEFDNKAHVSAALECSSKTTAMLVAQLLSTLNAVKSSTTLPFYNLEVSSSANIVYMNTYLSVKTFAPTVR